MARLTLNEVLASVFDSDDDSDNFSHLDSESEKEDGVSAYVYWPAAVWPGEAGSA